MMALQAATANKLRGQLREHESMAAHTSWAVGGPAELYYRAADLEDLAAFLQSIPQDMPLTWIGLGSNLLVRDGGISGAVIATRGVPDQLNRVNDLQVEVGAGVTCAKLARQSADWGLSGGSFFAGIPGLVGGALAMNAGAHGGETWARVIAVQTIDRSGRLRWRQPDDYEIGYRSVVAKFEGEEWFVAARLVFQPDEDGQALNDIRALQAQRAATQPIDMRSCGSVFRNPPGDHAARLIEACGLKGTVIGGAQVSTKHANFIVNQGKASAADIEALILRVKEKVANEQGVELIAEVRVLGECE